MQLVGGADTAQGCHTEGACPAPIMSRSSADALVALQDALVATTACLKTAEAEQSRGDRRCSWSRLMTICSPACERSTRPGWRSSGAPVGPESRRFSAASLGHGYPRPESCDPRRAVECSHVIRATSTDFWINLLPYLPPPGAPRSSGAKCLHDTTVGKKQILYNQNSSQAASSVQASHASVILPSRI